MKEIGFYNNIINLISKRVENTVGNREIGHYTQFPFSTVVLRRLEKEALIPLSHYDHELYESPRIDKLSNSWNSAKFMDRIVTFYELVTI